MLAVQKGVRIAGERRANDDHANRPTGRQEQGRGLDHLAGKILTNRERGVERRANYVSVDPVSDPRGRGEERTNLIGQTNFL